MRIVLQRVSEASVRVAGREVARIGRGLLLLVGIGRGDDEDELRFWSRKIPELRVFPDDDGRMNRSLRDVGGEILCVSQFTLYGDASQGRRPGFDRAAPGSEAASLYETFLARLREEGFPVQSGLFGARMEVALVNDGPVTLILERAPAQLGRT
ncbi:D-aminoacyl-tRNA deacylase [Candidatus Bipolaricaulis anaerobius]|jgi:D-tyrosyl-tRNA(Tyr) deacylase|uniref:D-aminoacyl-tRNA deacylase n=1 Tax=Candidatus Bipolaricaulis anaerobius TaxID=2026885 RepID=A0A2X3K591_9BACT|nr:D-aminoacyl-tRNA deacylase [Candidatus Bipolaricaulis anaerobius]SQD92447.1 D-aminoacyl-tRNA deacylase [Candidatus Bipolaricaulis anaerobius]HOD73250.1 D-aminoacyl-tRNA deacylase [Candidatus Bipolaricaulis anaerobius]HQM37956.1 D-aminoacyl-tRNA deacylase [Candidatus Bipolaricaulis anaerobius]